jgi:hypothetical protein
MSQYKGNFVKPSYAVRLRTSRGGTAKIVTTVVVTHHAPIAWCYAAHTYTTELSVTECVNRLNSLGYMMK